MKISKNEKDNSLPAKLIFNGNQLLQVLDQLQQLEQNKTALLAGLRELQIERDSIKKQIKQSNEKA